MVICRERGADLHMAQLMPLPLIISCFIKMQIGFTFLVLAHPGSPGKRAIKLVCVCSSRSSMEVVHVVGDDLFSYQIVNWPIVPVRTSKHAVLVRKPINETADKPRKLAGRN